MNWKDKKVLVTGSSGMIGKELVEQLIELGADIKKVDITIMDEMDLRDCYCCLDICQDMDYVFHLAGIKGNPKMTNEKPVDFMGPMLQFDTNMILAAQEKGIKRFLYTSSIAVENPETDKFPAWAKQTAETLIEAMRIQYPDGTKYCIVRPANVYGKYDDFKRENLMVISDLIKKGLKSNMHASSILQIWGSGKSERDFINAKDCARGMIQAMEQMPDFPVNLCSGEGIKIIDIAKIICKELNLDFLTGNQDFGAERRVMKINWDFKPEISIEEGIKEVIEWKKNME